MDNNILLADILLPQVDKTPSFYEELYKKRDLPEGAQVTRIAPSPTGYLHLGTLYAALVNRITATSSGGVFFTRIEDTDKKREVEGGISDIIDGLNNFGIKIDEGFISGENQNGEYGPYKQSMRAEIYQTYVKELIRQGKAYPCFCTEQDLSTTREYQEQNKIRTGYHGEFAKCRNLTFEEIKANIEAGKKFVVRLRSSGDESHKIAFTDQIKGKIEMPENDEDFVILKSDGIPTYHFAHAVDDHLMQTTVVMRGDEWLSSVPKHLELFRTLGFKTPKYAHIAPIMKLENGAKRKISKRKDPEAAVHFFHSEGYPAGSVIEYLMTVAASDFEDWRKANHAEDYRKFRFSLKKMSVSGALFDENKLLDVSKNVISRLSGQEVYQLLTNWAKEYDSDYYALLTKDTDFTLKMLSIDRGGNKPRKDLARMKDAKEYYEYFFNESYKPCYQLPENIEKNDAAEFLRKYSEIYDNTLPREEWFNQIKNIAPSLGFAAETKEYKQSPESFKGHSGDLSTVLRIAITGRRNTPDLCSIMQVLGRDECIKRLNDAASIIS